MNGAGAKFRCGGKGSLTLQLRPWVKRLLSEPFVTFLSFSR